MSNTYDVPMHLYTAQINAAKRWFDSCFASTERVDRILRQTAREFVHAELASAKAMAAARSPQDFVSVFDAHARPSYERMLACNQEVMRAVVEAGAEAFNAAQRLGNQAAADAQAMANGGAGEATDPFASAYRFWEDNSKRFFESLPFVTAMAEPGSVKEAPSKPEPRSKSTRVRGTQ